MHSIGVSWGQLRILTASLKLWCNCNLDPSWEILQQDQVRRAFKNDAVSDGMCDVTGLLCHSSNFIYICQLLLQIATARLSKIKTTGAFKVILLPSLVSIDNGFCMHAIVQIRLHLAMCIK